MLDYLHNRFKNPFMLSFLHISFVIIVYVFTVWRFFSHTFVLGFDNAGYHFPDYIYFSNSIRHGFSLPGWYPYGGGIPAGITSVNMFPLVPHRIVGYFLYAVLHLQPITLYKINIVSGMIIISIGWWLFLYQLIKSRLSATVGSLALLLGGSGYVIFHMEQDLATMSYIPWILLALIQIKKQFSYILVFAILCGFALATHYPFHGLFFIIFLFLSLILSGKFNWIFSQKILARERYVLLLAFIFFLLAALPLLYTAKTKDNFSSSVRQDRIIEKVTYENYQKMAAGSSSVTANFFTDTLKPLTYGDSNEIAFRTTIVHIILAIIGLFYYRISIPVVIVMGLSVWATLGINSSLPYLLFKIHFPAIGYFRQWYHFVTIVNFCLSVLVALGVASLLYLSRISISMIRKISDHGQLYNRIAVWVISIFTIIPMIYLVRPNFNQYAKLFESGGSIPEVSRFNKNRFMDELRGNLFSKPLTLFMYTDWWDLTEQCPELIFPSSIIKPPFITRAIYNNLDNHSKFNNYLKDFCNSGVYNYSAIAAIPAEKIKNTKMDIMKITDDYIFSKSNLISNYYLNAGEYNISPSGISLKVKTSEEAMAVLPYDYKLKLKVYLNGKRVETYPVYNGAMTGIFLPRGEFNVEAKMPFSFYEFAILVQALLVAFIFMYLIFDLVIKPRRL